MIIESLAACLDAISSSSWRNCAHLPTAKRLYDFLNLPFRDETISAFVKPHNVNRPEDRLLDARERERFDAIAGAMMQRLGYAQSLEYVVNY